MAHSLFNKSIVGRMVSNKCNLFKELITLTHDYKNETSKNLKKIFVKKYTEQNETNIEVCFDDGYRIGIWYKDKNNNLSLTESAQKVLNEEITVQNYLDIFILHYLVNINEKAYNIFYLLLKYLNAVGGIL